MVRYVFQNPNWLMNLLFLAICNFIPIIGPIVMIGYQYDIIESLYRYPSSTYPNFDFNFFVDYLKRGVWPFLVMLAASLVMVPIMAVILITIMVGTAAMADGNPQGGLRRLRGSRSYS